MTPELGTAPPTEKPRSLSFPRPQNTSSPWGCKTTFDGFWCFLLNNSLIPRLKRTSKPIRSPAKRHKYKDFPSSDLLVTLNQASSLLKTYENLIWSMGPTWTIMTMRRSTAGVAGRGAARPQITVYSMRMSFDSIAALHNFGEHHRTSINIHHNQSPFNHSTWPYYLFLCILVHLHFQCSRPVPCIPTRATRRIFLGIVQVLDMSMVIQISSECHRDKDGTFQNYNTVRIRDLNHPFVIPLSSLCPSQGSPDVSVTAPELRTSWQLRHRRGWTEPLPQHQISPNLHEHLSHQVRHWSR